ncbi:TetR/AcrR family transcriptional regulator [Microbacterium sp. Sa4CUA7]|uniref:TetR/AcrR family transcriptional regulator n=1 Tax=Microbacterium pullorum TaxID=2762236 RepID=A0ABR8S3R1_9MICO|nr:TetR/AcrR family transcriptional regulator [Microbacterium pullorum]MBD7957749.1 TetR/AcrR family transcriptional regulator [Microbacterium pullorum]
MSAPKGPRGPYAKTPRVRQQILEAALAVFAESGYRATTMKEIAERAGISQRGLVHHFGSKEALLLGVLELREAESGILAASAGTDAISAIIRIIEDNYTRPGLIELHSTLAAEAVSPEHPAHDHYVQRYRDFRAYLTSAFEVALGPSDGDGPLTAAQMAATVIALLDGLQLQWLYDRESVDLEAIVRRVILTFAPAALPDDADVKATR